jgi:hypothetical protein
MKNCEICEYFHGEIRQAKEGSIYCEQHDERLTKNLQKVFRDAYNEPTEQGKVGEFKLTKEEADACFDEKKQKYRVRILPPRDPQKEAGEE